MDRQGGSSSVLLRAWDATAGRWVRVTVDHATGAINTTSTGGGGGGGAVTEADGANVALGSTGDASSASTVVGLLKAIKAAITGTVNVAVASLPLPSGAATGTKQDTGNTSLASILALLPAALVGGRLDVNVGNSTTIPVSGPLTDTQLRATPVPVSGPLTDTQLRASAVPVSVATLPLPSGAAKDSTLTDGTQRVGGTVTISGTVAISGGVGVTGTFWQATQPVSVAQPSAAVASNVTGDGTSKALAASNGARKGLMVFNDSGVTCYLKLGTSASSSSFTVKMVDQSYYELPAPVYTGAVEALWASGSVRVTET